MLQLWNIEIHTCNTKQLPQQNCKLRNISPFNDNTMAAMSALFNLAAAWPIVEFGITKFYLLVKYSNANSISLWSVRKALVLWPTEWMTNRMKYLNWYVTDFQANQYRQKIKAQVLHGLIQLCVFDSDTIDPTKYANHFIPCDVM